MPIIDYIDGENRRIYLHSDTVGTSVHPMDVYREMRVLRRTDESLRPYDVFLKAYGNVPKGGGKYTERYVQCMLGTRIVPYDATQLLTITGTIITDDGQEGISCFDRAPLTVTTVVDIAYVPPQVEVITITTGGSALTTEEHDKLYETNDLTRAETAEGNGVKLDTLLELLGLDIINPVTIGNGKYLSTNLDIDVIDNGNGTYTLSRN